MMRTSFVWQRRSAPMLAERQSGRRQPLAYRAAGAEVIAGEGGFGAGSVEEIEPTAAPALRRCHGTIVVDPMAAGPIDDVALAPLRRRGGSVAIVGAAPRARDVLDAAAQHGIALTTNLREALRVLEPVVPNPSPPPPSCGGRPSQHDRTASTVGGHVVTHQSDPLIGARAPRAPNFSIVVEPRRDAVRVAPRGELDIATVTQLQHELAELIDAGFARIVIDLRGVEFLDSTAVRALIAAHTRAQRDGWMLEIIPGSGAVQRVFELTGTLDWLPFTGIGRKASPASVKTSSIAPPEATSTNGVRAQRSLP